MSLVTQQQAPLDALIVGSGFSGLAAAYYLSQSGFDNLRIVEKAPELGGTWYFNRYPGCGCDVQSHLYSYSFRPRHDWPQTYSNWQEILKYLNDTADDLDLRKFITFNCAATKAEYDSNTKSWQVQLSTGESLTTRFLVNSAGPLHVPNKPNFPGLESFAGRVMHSAEWDEKYDFSTKSVVSIGTGASAIQYVPELAKLAKKLTVVQRTPAWVVPKVDHQYSLDDQDKFKKRPWRAKLHRLKFFWSNEMTLLAFNYPFIGRFVEDKIRYRIKRHVQSREKQEKLMPDYRLGCKRVLLSQDYYKAFNRDNVHLVTEKIDRFTEDSVVFADGKELACDVVVLGTGFVVDPRKYMTSLPILGREGLSLLEAWHEAPRAYFGMTSPEFPNFFVMIGPNTALGHNSMIAIIEAQAKYIAKCLAELKRRSVSEIEVRKDVLQDFDRRTQAKLTTSIWQSGCRSWYQDSGGHNFAIWPGTTYAYMSATKKPNFAHFNFS